MKSSARDAGKFDKPFATTIADRNGGSDKPASLGLDFVRMMKNDRRGLVWEDFGPFRVGLRIDRRKT